MFASREFRPATGGFSSQGFSRESLANGNEGYWRDAERDGLNIYKYINTHTETRHELEL